MFSSTGADGSSGTSALGGSTVAAWLSTASFSSSA
jgi:hypothetical protein